MDDYDIYRLNLLAKAVKQLNERAGNVIDEELLTQLEYHFQYHFDENYEDWRKSENER